ncbi:MAG: MNIO family bufferin maturase [Planctomycetota bacterium]|jgi:uncharacterized protein (UPF0276 family)
MAGTPTPCRFDIPELGFGMGLRTVHYEHILEAWPDIGWFEIISENFMGVGGRPRANLEAIAARYPIVLHGVSMNIGTTDPLDTGYLDALKELAESVDTPIVSDHVCWTGVDGTNLHDLLPLPYTEEALAHLIDRVNRVQDHLGRWIALENPSTYLEFTDTTMTEWEFIGRLAEAADCGVMLDLNNVYVSSFNHGFDPADYIDAMPHDRVVYYHLAGHTNRGTHIIDTHSDHVIDPVWELLRRSWSHTGGRPATLEWDENIPPFDVVWDEVRKARDRVADLAEAGT